jgi:lipopolysaccharide transport system ATP-binding protein
VSEVIVKAEGVRKKFCRELKRSLWYGLKDIASDLNPIGRNSADGLPPGPAVERRHELRPGEFWAVNDVSFEVRRGECLGLIGHNGAGKTTLLKLLNGLFKPDSGRIEMRGRVGALIALGAGFNPILTGRENIYVNAAVLGLTRKETDERLEDIINFAEIREFIDAPVQGYSSGMAVRLGFAIAAHCRPDILLLDEVLAVGDMGFQAKCFNALGEFRNRGTAFVLVSHNMHQITRFCSRALYLDHGQPAFLGCTEEAVERFHADNLRNGADPGEPAQDVTVGTGRVRIKRVYFLDESGRESAETQSGRSMTIVVEYRSQPQAPPFLMDLTLRDNDGLLYQASTQSQGLAPGRPGPSGRFRVVIQSMPANDQRIRVGIALWSGDFCELLDWKRGVPLIVRGHSLSTGRCFLSTEWTHEPAEAPASRAVAPAEQLR